jgi:hypothetical protein
MNILKPLHIFIFYANHTKDSEHGLPLYIRRNEQSTINNQQPTIKVSAFRTSLTETNASYFTQPQKKSLYTAKGGFLTTDVPFLVSLCFSFFLRLSYSFCALI